MSTKVLICDDQEGVRESLNFVLKDHYEIIAVEDGEQCLEALKSHKDVRVVLIDIKMPRIDGLQILKKIKASRPDIKIIVVTGYKSVETAAEATRLGASGYIIKPFASAEILEAVGQFTK